MSFKKAFNKIAAFDLSSDCSKALKRICEKLREFGYCGGGLSIPIEDIIKKMSPLPIWEIPKGVLDTISDIDDLTDDEMCSEIQRAINEYNHRWDACVRPWAKKCGRTDTNHDLADIPYFYGWPVEADWWGCVRGTAFHEKMSECTVEILDEIAAISNAFRQIIDDINTINLLCPDCNFDLGGRLPIDGEPEAGCCIGNEDVTDEYGTESECGLAGGIWGTDKCGGVEVVKVIEKPEIEVIIEELPDIEGFPPLRPPHEKFKEDTF